MLCRIIAGELDKAEGLCRQAGPGSVSSDLWLSSVALSDALSEYWRNLGRMQGMPSSGAQKRAS